MTTARRTGLGRPKRLWPLDVAVRERWPAVAVWRALSRRETCVRIVPPQSVATRAVWKLTAACMLVWLSGCTVESTSPRTRPTGNVIRLATTTSARDSGVLDVLLSAVRRQTGIRCNVIAIGTGEALELGRRGDVDVVLVHAREAEEQFLRDGHGVRREDLMWNRFMIVGPADDPAGIRGLGVRDALQRIAEKRVAFVSRGDDSGTHKRERAFWAELGIRPEWPEYIETGLGQGRTLMVADQVGAYCLTDEATFRNLHKRLELVPLVTDDPRLRNEYGVIVVSARKHPGVRVDLAERFVEFLISPAGQAVIAGFRIEGRQVFRPAHGAGEVRAEVAHRGEAPAIRAGNHQSRHGQTGKERQVELIREAVREAWRMMVHCDPLVLDAAWRSVWVSSTAVLLATMLGLPVGTLLAGRRGGLARTVVLVMRTAMAVPTVFVGVVCFALLSRRGPLGGLEILYTPWAIVAGEFLLALPIVVAISHGAVASLDPRVDETARMLGAGRLRRWVTQLSEARTGVALAVLTAFARCVTELGIAVIVGGNIKYRTRTLSTATALETSRGDFGRALAMGIILLVISLAAAAVIGRLSRTRTA